MTTIDMSKRRALIEKVEKLLRLSESANEHEAALAAQKVQDLLTTYNLDLGEIQGHARSVDEAMGIVRVPFIKGKRGVDTGWEVSLAGLVARHFYCDVLFSTFDIVFFGTETNLEVATYVYAQVANRLWALSGIARNAYTVQMRKDLEARGTVVNRNSAKNKMSPYDPYFLAGDRHPNKYRLSWLSGAVSGVGVKLREMRDQVVAEARGAALVRDMSAALDAFKRKTWPQNYGSDGKEKGGFMIKSRHVNWDGYEAGFEEGRAMDIHKGLGGKQKVPAALEKES